MGVFLWAWGSCKKSWEGRQNKFSEVVVGSSRSRKELKIPGFKHQQRCLHFARISFRLLRDPFLSARDMRVFLSSRVGISCSPLNMKGHAWGRTMWWCSHLCWISVPGYYVIWNLYENYDHFFTFLISFHLPHPPPPPPENWVIVLWKFFH